MNEYIRVGNKSLRLGITTGGCAALAAKAAVIYMMKGECPGDIGLVLKDIPVTEKIADSGRDGGYFFCAIKKDAGDDPDVTDGMLIYAYVKRTDEKGISIDGGEGIGRVTKAGLDQPVGNAAINSGPRALIERAVREAFAECDQDLYSISDPSVEVIELTDEICPRISVIITAPGGEDVAKRTFNPNLGIEGGISILGTTGIEEPMSEKAMIDSIRLEIKQASVESKRLILTPGNYGYNMTNELGLTGVDVPVVLYSGFLGVALDAACENDFEEVLLISHIGKLVKTAGGIMNTHQREADCRRELITAHAAAEGATTEMCRRLMEAATTDAAIEILDEEAGAGIADAAAGGEIADSSGDMIEVSGGYTSSLRERVCRRIMDAVMYYLNRRIESAYHIEAIMFSNQYGILEKSDGADKLIEGWRG